jgi:hypothetical protein
MMAHKTNSHILWAIVALGIFTIPSGCVRRRLTVRTNPPGAMVYVDHQPIGQTPVSHSFTYYGTRHFEIVRDGYKTEKFLRTFNPPWYQIPPLDFFAENVWPYEKRDERIVDVQLTPDQPIATESLIANGESLRLQAGQGIAVAPLQPNQPTSIIPGLQSPWGYAQTNPQQINPIPVYPNQTYNPAQVMTEVLTSPERTSGVPEVTPGGSYRPTIEEPGTPQ